MARKGRKVGTGSDWIGGSGWMAKTEDNKFFGRRKGWNDLKKALDIRIDLEAKSCRGDRN